MKTGKPEEVGGHMPGTPASGVQGGTPALRSNNPTSDNASQGIHEPIPGHKGPPDKVFPAANRLDRKPTKFGK